MEKRLRAGIIGLEAGRSWASIAHLPGLRAQPERFEVAGVANRSQESSSRAAHACGIPAAFSGVADMLASPGIDFVTVAVRVPHHREVLEQVLASGKPVYCEWPLAKNLEEAEAICALAAASGARTCIGTQALGNFQLRRVRELVAGGAVGRVLSHAITGWGRLGGPEIADEAHELYLLDRACGADMLSISAGHTLAALQWIGGRVETAGAVLATRRSAVFSRERGGPVPLRAPDQIAIHGQLADGSVYSLHYRGGLPPDGRGLSWEIEGTDGVIRIVAASGCIQIEDCTVELWRRGGDRFQRVEAVQEDPPVCPGDFQAGNVGRMYAMFRHDLLHGTHTAPSFADALDLHRLLDRIERHALQASAGQGR